MKRKEEYKEMKRIEKINKHINSILKILDKSEPDMIAINTIGIIRAISIKSLEMIKLKTEEMIE